jgi:Tse2 ADP-ribosyltransferase toxins
MDLASAMRPARWEYPMSHTIVELYVKVIPTGLFRLGSKNSPQLHKLRTMPPRTIAESFDIEIYDHHGESFVAKDTGGISTFDQKNNFGEFWWVIPKGTPIPAGLRVSQDFNPKPGLGPTHYTIRPLHDMPLTMYIGLLEKLGESAERTFKVQGKSAGRL